MVRNWSIGFYLISSVSQIPICRVVWFISLPPSVILTKGGSLYLKSVQRVKGRTSSPPPIYAPPRLWRNTFAGIFVGITKKLPECSIALGVPPALSGQKLPRAPHDRRRHGFHPPLPPHRPEGRRPSGDKVPLALPIAWQPSCPAVVCRIKTFQFLQVFRYGVGRGATAFHGR